VKRPLIVWLVVVFAVFSALVNCSRALSAMVAFDDWPFSMVLGQIIVSACIAGASIWIVHGLETRSFRSRTPVSIYLWILLFSYPLINVLIAYGLYLPEPTIAPKALLVASVVEIARYLWILFLIAWVSLSKALREYLVGKVSDPSPARKNSLMDE
jgi:NO-binding membrane sensor protein with MHYT domain